MFALRRWPVKKILSESIIWCAVWLNLLLANNGHRLLWRLHDKPTSLSGDSPSQPDPPHMHYAGASAKCGHHQLQLELGAFTPYASTRFQLVVTALGGFSPGRAALRTRIGDTYKMVGRLPGSASANALIHLNLPLSGPHFSPSNPRVPTPITVLVGSC